MIGFNAEEYWKDKPSKSWVVSLTSTKRVGKTKVKKNHTVYVRARDSQRAIHTARINTFLKGKISGHCRLATPTDLGCVPTPQGKD